MLKLGLSALAAGALIVVSSGPVWADAGPLPPPDVSAGISPTSTSAGGSGQTGGVKSDSAGAAANQGGQSGYTCGSQANASGTTYTAEPAHAGTPGSSAAPSCAGETAAKGGQVGSPGQVSSRYRGGAVSGSQPIGTAGVSTGTSAPAPTSHGAQGAHATGIALADTPMPIWPWMLLPVGLLLLLVGSLILLAASRRRRAVAS